MTEEEMNTAGRGALAGIAGGLAMAGMMFKVAPKVVPADMLSDGFVPKKAVEWAEAQVGRPNALTDEQAQKVAMAVHLGYSALGGALYGLARQKLEQKEEHIPLPVAGALFGLAVWALSFEGWLPAVGIMKRTTDKPVKKWPAPIMGHLVYGTATALAFEALGSM